MTGQSFTTEEMLSTLIAFDTTSRDGNIPLIEFVESYLDGWGVPHFRVDYEQGKKTNLFATIGPAIAGGIVLSGHTDVVPVDGQNWSSRTVGAESDLTDIAHQNGQYMIVGSHAMVLLSLPVKPVSILSDSLTKLPGSGMQFHVSGQPGRVLDIQSSSNLVDWSNLLRQTNSTGTAVITDSAPASERRFYRAVQQP